MAPRLHELHPALVHAPLALLPTSLGFDLMGRLTDSAPLMDVGRRTMPRAAAGAALAGLSGLVAQASVVAEGEAHDALITHRTLNAAAVVASAAMAGSRVRRDRPGWGYLLAGVATLGGALYAASLGGRMVYALGVGVNPSGGLHEDRAPEVTDRPVAVTRRAAGQMRDAAEHAARHLAEGEVAPELRPGPDTAGEDGPD